MSGKLSRIGSYQVQGGRGRGRSDIGYSYYGATPKNKVLCSALDNRVFYYGQKASSDQLRTTWDNLVHHIGKIHGHNISNGLMNKKTLVITKPYHYQDSLDEHQFATIRRDQSCQRSVEVRQLQKGLFEDQVMEG